jgi:hypothetical protein
MRHGILPSPAVLLAGATLLAGARLEAQAGTSIRDAVLGEAGQVTAEISTDELTRVLRDRSATVLDARPYAEYAISHVPGALNVAPKPGGGAFGLRLGCG